MIYRAVFGSRDRISLVCRRLSNWVCVFMVYASLYPLECNVALKTLMIVSDDPLARLDDPTTHRSVLRALFNGGKRNTAQGIMRNDNNPILRSVLLVSGDGGGGGGGGGGAARNPLTRGTTIGKMVNVIHAAGPSLHELAVTIVHGAPIKSVNFHPSACIESSRFALPVFTRGRSLKLALCISSSQELLRKKLWICVPFSLRGCKYQRIRPLPP